MAIPPFDLGFKPHAIDDPSHVLCRGNLVDHDFASTGIYRDFSDMYRMGIGRGEV